MQWRIWGLYDAFVSRFGEPVVPDTVKPAQLAQLMEASILSGKVAAPLTLKSPLVRINNITVYRRPKHPRDSAKLRRYLDDLDAPPRQPGEPGIPPDIKGRKRGESE